MSTYNVTSFAQIDAFIGYNANMMSEENAIRVELKSTTIKEWGWTARNAIARQKVE